MSLRILVVLVASVVLAACAGATPRAGADVAPRVSSSAAEEAATSSHTTHGTWHDPTCPAPLPDLVQPFAAVRYLADDALEGRASGSEGERCAAAYIAAELARLGLTPAGGGGTFFQQVPLASVVNPHAQGGTGRNVLALLEGSDPDLRHEVVVIGAHYDHLGWGPLGSLSPDTRAIHNGADDNASGVAGLITAADRLARGPRPRRSIVFAAFTGEELGLLGSAHYVANAVVPIERTTAMLNLDMVGRVEDEPLIVYGLGTAEEWTARLEAANVDGLPLALQPEGFGPSDHTSFYLRDVPVLHFFSNVHADYHRPSDTWEKIDTLGVRRVGELVARVAHAVADSPARLTLVRGAGEPPRPRGGASSGAWLGTVPDFTPVEHGVRLGGVSAGSPAEGAGLRAGDILIRMDDDEITDLQAMTDALRARAPGDPVRVVFLRDGAERSVDVILGRRR